MRRKLWKVLIPNDLEGEIKSIQFSDNEMMIISSWIKFIERYGPHKLSDFNIIDIPDHPLTRQKKWIGHRSSSFSKRGRIIYRIDEAKMHVIVVRISRDHNYQ